MDKYSSSKLRHAFAKIAVESELYVWVRARGCLPWVSPTNPWMGWLTSYISTFSTLIECDTTQSRGDSQSGINGIFHRIYASSQIRLIFDRDEQKSRETPDLQCKLLLDHDHFNCYLYIYCSQHTRDPLNRMGFWTTTTTTIFYQISPTRTPQLRLLDKFHPFNYHQVYLKWIHFLILYVIYLN